MKKPKQRNFVHLHMVEFNTSKVYTDRKKEQKKGKKRKHKGQSWD